MKTYIGKRDEDGTTHVTVDGVALNPRLDLHNHSPNGLEWGYPGSGPAQLALAILAEHFKGEPGADESALELYQQFKFAIVTSLAHDGWTLQTDQIERALKAITQQ